MKKNYCGLNLDLLFVIGKLASKGSRFQLPFLFSHLFKVPKNVSSKINFRLEICSLPTVEAPKHQSSHIRNRTPGRGRLVPTAWLGTRHRQVEKQHKFVLEQNIKNHFENKLWLDAINNIFLSIKWKKCVTINLVDLSQYR